MSRSLGLSALVLLFVSVNASLVVDSQPITGVSQDGVCGNGITCVGSEYGNCCSIDGACGSSIVECGVGCQSLFGVCPDAPLRVNHDDEYAILFERAIEERAVPPATSSLCTSATARRTTSSSILTTTKPTTTSSPTKKTTSAHSISKRAASSVVCVASQTSRIRVNRPSPSTDSWCNSWLAARPHSNSPFPLIPNPLDVSNACLCILQADASSSTVKTTTTTSTSATCAPSVTALIRVNRPSTDSWCTTWLAQRPHSNSPFPKIPNPLDVSNACQCILSADAASSSKTSSKTSSTTTTSKSTTTTASKTSSSSVTTNAGSSTSTAKACSLKERKRRRRRDIPLTLEVAV